MGLDEILFRGINGVAGQSSLLDWIGVELAKPGNLLEQRKGVGSLFFTASR